MNGNGLFGSTTVDVVIGLIFVYLLLAIICTNLNEWIAGLFNTRSRTLETAIRQLLDEQAGKPDALQDTNWFLRQFYRHPLIAGMCEPGKRKTPPAYLASRAFAIAVMDIATPGIAGTITFADLEAGIKKLPDGDVKTSLLAVIQTAHGDINLAQRNIQGWYEDTMQRVSGWYKKKTQLWTAIIATLLVICANADTVQITKTLWRDPTLRAELIEKAKDHAASATSAAPVADSDQNHVPDANTDQAIKDDLNVLGGVIGWTHQAAIHGFWPWADRLLGWFLSIVAVSLGAPFWFDLLNKFMRVRNGGDAPEEVPATPQSQQPVSAAQAAPSKAVG
ncbi:MAG TPA: hypothetical protein VMD98_02270 [Bryocella sp.]|nr:hypothetical protein [Bryocella sp.]